MLPTLYNEIVLVLKFNNKILGKPFAKGDIVISQNPQGKNYKVCKRINATEGETIHQVLNGQAFDAVVPKDHVWLLGDNLDQSIDSRKYGFVPVSYLEGKVYSFRNKKL